jgi:hypothetical protein
VCALFFSENRNQNLPRMKNKRNQFVLDPFWGWTFQRILSKIKTFSGKNQTNSCAKEFENFKKKFWNFQT